MYEQFAWRGEPIKDIEQWAKDRGEEMIHYRARRNTVYGIEEFEGKMPQSFWQGLLMRDGWWYEEISVN